MEAFQSQKNGLRDRVWELEKKSFTFATYPMH